MQLRKRLHGLLGDELEGFHVMNISHERILDVQRLHVLTERLIYMQEKIKQIKQERKQLIRRLGKEYDNLKKFR